MSARPAPTPAELASLCLAHSRVRARSVRASPPASPAPTRATLAGEAVTLHPDRALGWPARSTLFVADVHLGKEHVFGRAGIPVPGGVSERALERLARLVATTGVERLVVLGDLMHDTPGEGESWLGALSGFLDAHGSLTVEVCAGNHDRVEARPRLDPRLRWLDEPRADGPFVLRHHPADDPRGHVLAGHVHPVWRLDRRRGDGPRLPAFWTRPGHTVLPAFGEFTGGHRVERGDGDRVWVAGPERVVAVGAGRG